MAAKEKGKIQGAAETAYKEITKKAVASALGTALPGVGQVVGNAVGGLIADVGLRTQKAARKLVLGAAAGVGAGIALLASGVGVAFASVGAGLAAAGTTALIGIIAIPLAVILISFIINTGAYVVPPSPGFSSAGPIDFSSTIGDATCPLPGGHAGVNDSYHAGDESKGHGSTHYWNDIMGEFCSFAIPQGSGCEGPSNSGNLCSNQANTCPYYGFASDIFSSQSREVFAPTINGESLTWKRTGGFSNGGATGAGWSHIYTDSTGRYVIVLTHTIQQANQDQNIPSGTKLTELFDQAGNTHLHLEFQAEGVWQRPEDWFCK